MPFFVPSLGVTLDRAWSTARLRGHMGFEQSVPAIAGTTSQDLANFSAGEPREPRRQLAHPLGRSRRLDLPAAAGSTARASTRSGQLRPREMTHELAWRFGGQTSLGTRVIPQAEGVLGGVATVRGYPQSITAGDSFVNGSVEYRYHVPLGFVDLQPVQVPWFGDFRLGPDAVAAHARLGPRVRGVQRLRRGVQPVRACWASSDDPLASMGVGHGSRSCAGTSRCGSTTASRCSSVRHANVDSRATANSTSRRWCGTEHEEDPELSRALQHILVLALTAALAVGPAAPLAFAGPTQMRGNGGGTCAPNAHDPNPTSGPSRARTARSSTTRASTSRRPGRQLPRKGGADVRVLNRIFSAAPTRIEGTIQRRAATSTS